MVSEAAQAEAERAAMYRYQTLVDTRLITGHEHLQAQRDAFVAGWEARDQAAEDEIAYWRRSAQEWEANEQEQNRRADTAEERIEFYKRACAVTEHEVQQILGQALGYPWFKDDQANFPGAKETDGVAVGEHVAATLAAEMVSAYRVAEERIAALTALVNETRDIAERLNEGELTYTDTIDMLNDWAKRALAAVSDRDQGA